MKIFISIFLLSTCSALNLEHEKCHGGNCLDQNSKKDILEEAISELNHFSEELDTLTEELHVSHRTSGSSPEDPLVENLDLVLNAVKVLGFLEYMKVGNDDSDWGGFDMTVDENHKIIDAVPSRFTEGQSQISEGKGDGQDFDENMFAAYYDPDKTKAAMVAGKDNHCYIGFRSTDSGIDWFRDWLYNFQVFPFETDQCHVHHGFFIGFNAIYRDNLLAKLDECVEEYCDGREDDCVIITGFSQGAGIARVAATELQAKYTPKLVVTIGTPKGIDKDCESSLDPDRMIRICNTMPHNGGIGFDPACDAGFETSTWGPALALATGWGPGSSVTNAAAAGMLETDDGYFGHSYLLPPEIDTAIKYIGKDLESDVNFFNTNPFLINFAQAHCIFCDFGYRNKLLNLAAHRTQISTDGFKNEQSCVWNYQCASDNCKNDVCRAKGGTGSVCFHNSECLSGRCEGTFNIQNGQCRDMLEDGEGCNDNSDCISGNCEGFLDWTCTSKLRNGNSCNEDSDCISGRCDWFFECAAKLPAGQFCINDGDCNSGNCKTLYTWWGPRWECD